MGAGGDPDGEVAGFLEGDTRVIGGVREAVDRVVRSFQFPDSALNKDLAQDSLMRLFVNLSAGRFRGDSSLATYARRVARYTCLEHLRRRRFEVGLDPEVVASRARWAEPEESFLWTEEHLRNLEIFASLPPDCRELLKLVFIEGRSYREIGVRLGVSEGAIKTRVHRCRRALREAARRFAAAARGRRTRRVRP